MDTMSIANRPAAPARARPAAGAGSPLKLNLGCGPVQPAGWINVDGSNRAVLASRFWPLDRLLVRLGVLSPTEFGPQVTVHDLLKPLPFADNSAACIYAGELWEHFELPDAERLTRECVRVLAPGGVLRVCVPDGAAFWRRYLELYDQQMALGRADRSAAPLRRHVQLYFHDICTRRRWFGSMGHVHKWQFDEIQLVQLFEEAGLTQVARMPLHRSRIADIDLVERSDFLIVEGIKAGRGDEGHA